MVFVSIVYLIVIFIVAQFKGPKVRIFNNTTSFDKSKLPLMFKFLAIVTLASVLVGYIFTRRFGLILQFIGLNLLISIIMGSNIFLLRDRSEGKRKN